MPKSLICMCLLLAGGFAPFATPRVLAADSTLTLSWRNLFTVFRQRYQERSPARTLLEEADLSAEIAQGFRLDPVLTVDGARTRTEENLSISRSASLSQQTPFGTGLSLKREASQYPEGNPLTGGADERVASSITLSQDLLRNGPWAGFAQDDKAETARDLAILEYGIAYEQAIFDAAKAFVQAQSSQRGLNAAGAALKRAMAQNAAVKELVESGYKAKADLLVSEADELQRRIAVNRAEAEAEAARRALAEALWQRPKDPGLLVGDDDPPEGFLSRLEKVAWPEVPPTLKRAMLKVRIAELEHDLASRQDLPELKLQTTWSRSVDKIEGDESQSKGQSYGISFSMPLVTGITREKSRLAGLAATRAESEREEARQASESVRLNGQRSITVAEEALKAAERLYELSKKTLEIERQKYADGKSTIADLRRFQEDVDQAEQRVISVKADLIVHRLDYARAAGRLREALK